MESLEQFQLTLRYISFPLFYHGSGSLKRIHPIHLFAFCLIFMVVRPRQTQVKPMTLDLDWYHVWPGFGRYFGEHICSSLPRIQISLFSEILFKRHWHIPSHQVWEDHNLITRLFSYTQHANCAPNPSDFYRWTFMRYCLGGFRRLQLGVWGETVRGPSALGFLMFL